MSTSTLESFVDADAWTAHRPDGGPSGALSIRSGRPPRGPWRRTPTATVTATTDAVGHLLDRVGSPVDLNRFTDLVLWVRSGRPADGSPARPFFAEVRLGSAALTVGAPGNDWHRFIDIGTSETWQQVPMALADLAPQVRGAVTTLRLTCVDATQAWTLTLDRIIAARDELLADTDAALRARLDGRIDLGGVPVPAVVAPISAAPTAPFFRLSNYDVRPNPGRAPGASRRADHTRFGFSQRPPVEPFDLYYAVEAVADDRAEAVAMLDFAFAELVPRTTVECGARVVSVEWVDAPSWSPPGGGQGGAGALSLSTASADRPVLHLRVSTGRAPTAAAEPAVPIFNVVDVEVEQRV